MSFEVENNNIRVTDTDGSVVFDTATPMPHIAKVINTTVTHTFPNSPNQGEFSSRFTPNSTLCSSQEYVCTSDYVCDSVWVCEDRLTCGYVTDPWTGESEYDCWYEEECGYEQQCGWEETCGWETVYGDLREVTGWNEIDAAEYTETYTLGQLEPGTGPDFLQVLAIANRTKTGSQVDYGDFISAIPNTERISVGGSTVLEMAFEPGGTPWLSRIMSVYLSGDKIMAEFKHSNKSYISRTTTETSSCRSFPDLPTWTEDTSSEWQVSFDIYVGKFTI